MNNGFYWFVPVLVSFLVSPGHGRSIYDAIYGINKRIECPVYKNEALHAAFDRICDLCHEMYHHENPNLRAECRLVAIHSCSTRGGRVVPKRSEINIV